MSASVLCRPQGDGALMVYLAEAAPERVRALAQALLDDPAPGQLAVCHALACLQVRFDPLITDHDQVGQAVERAATGHWPAPAPGREVTVPVVYGGRHGPDLDFVAQQAGISPAEVIRRHGAAVHPCRFVGFTPGFAYLEGLDPDLACPRLESPRDGLPPGAVGIGGAQTGVYPLGGPGGWRIIGRTPLMLYDPGRAPTCLITPGDRVRFAAVGAALFPPPPPALAGWQPQGLEALEVLHPGGRHLIQDVGRWGHQGLGLPVSGALDQQALAVANALVGNPPGAAALELTLLGPRLKTLRPLSFALCGADLGPRIDRRPVESWTALELLPGQELDFSGPRDGSRAILALGGGLAATPLLGSRSAYPLGLLGAPLTAGQRLWLLPAAPLTTGRAVPSELRPQAAQSIELRAVAGPNQDMFPREAMDTLSAGPFVVGQQADRRGVRMRGPAVATLGQANAASEPVTPGVVQITPGGQPMILLREQTMGGYPQIATVIGPDLDLLARALPGDELRFRLIGPEEAVRAARSHQRDTMRIIEASCP